MTAGSLRAAGCGPGFQGACDLRVQRLAPRARQAFVGRLLDERMVKAVGGLFLRARGEDQAGFAQPLKALPQFLVARLGDRRQQIVRRTGAR